MNHQPRNPALIGTKSVVLGAKVRFVGWADSKARVEEPEINQIGTIIDMEKDMETDTLWLDVAYRLPNTPSRVFTHRVEEVSLVTLTHSKEGANEPIHSFA